MALDPRRLPPDVLAFLAEQHLATLTTIRPDGTPHVVPVGFTWDDEAGLVRIITGGGSLKVAHLRAAGEGARAVVCQFERRRWLTLEGPTTLTTEPTEVAEGVLRYTQRYREPSENAERVVIAVRVDRIMGRA